MQKKQNKNLNESSFYSKSIINENQKTEIYEKFKKNNKSLVIYTNSDNEKVRIYNIDGNTTTFFENTGKSEQSISVNNIIYSLEIKSGFDGFQSAFRCKIKDEKYNGIACYKISNFYDKNRINKDGYLYVDKETGLILESHDSPQTVEYQYNFNDIDDKIFELPVNDSKFIQGK